MQYEPWSKIFSCQGCDKLLRKIRACKKSRKRGNIEELPTGLKCICSNNPKCNICGGSGSIAVLQCPAKSQLTQEAIQTLPYFFHWKNTDFLHYPDGAGRLFQPVKMLEAFDVIAGVVARKEKEQLKKIRGKDGKS